ncbi:MAG: AMP-binding protein [Clostridia bacterium]|nr:AMP-binding protein [Clostridia bacterium]
MNHVDSPASFRELMDYCRAHYAQQPAVTDGSGVLTYDALIRRIGQYASLLQDIPEQFVVLTLTQQTAYAAAYIAAVLTGHIAVLLPSGHPLPASLAHAVPVGDDFARAAAEREPLSPDCLPDADPDACCTIAFSSGTASAAKGVMLSQRNLLEDAQNGMRLHRYWSGERLVHILPYWHLFGVVADLLGPLQAGCHLYMTESPLHFFPALRLFRPHSVNLPPALADTLCQAMTTAADPAQVTGGCLEKLMCAGAPLSPATLDRLLSFGVRPCLAYGLTECSPCVSLTPDDEIVPGSSGRPLGCVTVRIAEDGEILVRGSTVMLGYYGDPDATAEQITDGWLHTGDLGHIGDEGHLFVTGRKSSMLVFSSGMKCMPEPLEQRIARLPSVTECLLSVSPDGQRPVLTLVTQSEAPETLDEIMAQAGLVPYTLVLRKEPLKRNAMGKLVRKQ